MEISKLTVRRLLIAPVGDIRLQQGTRRVTAEVPDDYRTDLQFLPAWLYLNHTLYPVLPGRVKGGLGTVPNERWTRTYIGRAPRRPPRLVCSAWADSGGMGGFLPQPPVNLDQAAVIILKPEAPAGGIKIE